MIESLDTPYIHAANTENFKQLVIENSAMGPVLVNFWSRKAGPCLRQYPVLDKIIRDYNGRILLVNVDTESEFVFTKEYGIASVPTLKLFRNGQVVETLHGFQSEEDLSKLLDRYVSRPSDQTLAEIIQLYSEGSTTNAYTKLTDLIVDDPLNPRLPLAMCKLLKHEERYADAIKVIEALPEDIRKDKEISQLYDVLFFYQNLDNDVDVATLQAQCESANADITVRQQLIAYYVVHEQYELALAQLAHIIEADLCIDDNYAQTAMLKTFRLIGEGDSLVKKYRPLLKRYVH